MTLLVAVVLQCACSEQDSAAIRFGLSTAPVTLDPRYATDAVSSRINRLLYRKLVDFDEHYQLQPALADWEQLSPLHYRFRLKNQGRTFHDGSRLTAGDVKATYDAVLAPANISPHRATLANIDSITVIDEDTIDFLIREADPLFPGRLVIGILPANKISTGHPFNEQPIGSGPFRFLRWPSDDHLYLQRQSDQQVIEFITVADATVRVLKLVRGEIDLVQGDLPFELLAWLRERDGMVIETGEGSVFTYIGFNMQDPVLSILDIRRAIASALDRASIIRHVFGGAARQAGALLSSAHWAGHTQLQGVGYDPDKARTLLRSHGYTEDHPLRLTYKTSNNVLRLRLATIIQYQLGQVGIQVDLKSYDWGTFYGDIKSGRFQMYSLSWVGLNMPDIFRYAFHSASSPPAGANRGHYADTRVDALIEQAEAEIDLEQQAEIYFKLQEYLQDQLPYVPLWYEDNILARRHAVQGYRLSVDGDYDGLQTIKRVNK